MRGQQHAPAGLSPGKTAYQLYKRLSRTRGRSDGTENIATTGIRSPYRPAHKQVAIPTMPSRSPYFTRNMYNVHGVYQLLRTWRQRETLGLQKLHAVELGYNVMKGTEYFVSL
jgi:hypothetical protein